MTHRLPALVSRAAVAVAAVIAVAATSVRAPVRADAWDGPDKREHFVVGIDIAANGTLLAGLVTREPAWRALLGFALGTAAGAAKEGADALGLGDPSAKDFAWTALGAFVGAGLGWLISAIGD